eukprot:SAG11_NODE_391_length_9839_cov_4.875257_3_plen_90_part_00
MGQASALRNEAKALDRRADVLAPAPSAPRSTLSQPLPELIVPAGSALEGIDGATGMRLGDELTEDVEVVETSPAVAVVGAGDCEKAVGL